MQQIQLFRKIYSRFFPRKMAQPLPSSDRWKLLTVEKKKELTDHLLAQGEIALLNNDLSASSYFEAAANLSPQDYEVWYRPALSFSGCDFEPKAILLANRYFKQATLIAPDRPEVWASWGATLLKLGAVYKEHHFTLDAKEKFQRAIAESKNLPNSCMANLYWEYGLLWTELANYSGEALDLRLAIQAFRTSMTYSFSPSFQFLYDYGNAYLQMGLLTNDSRLYDQAIDLLQQALDLDDRSFDGWLALAEAYSQLYINTVDEEVCAKGCDCYARLCQKNPKNIDVWVGWAQLLGESGRVNRDAKKLQSSIEKCAIGYAVDPDHPILLAQWVESLSYLGGLTNRLDLLIEAEQKILDATDRFSDDPDLWHAYGICLISFGHYYADPDYYDYAIEKLQVGISIDRTHAELWHALALAHMHYASLTDDLELIERSTRFYSFALDLKPACPSLLFDAANAWLLSCDLHDDYKDLQQAIDLYESLLKNQRETLINHPEWLFQYATALEWLSDFTFDEQHCIRAIDLYLHILLIDPETPQIHFRIATCFSRLGETSGELEYYRRADQYFRFAVKQDEEDANVWLEWGLSFLSQAAHLLDSDLKQQCYLEAEQKILQAGQLGNQHAYYHLSCLYSQTGRCVEAMELLRKAQKFSALPPIEELMENEWLDNLRRTEMFAHFLSSLETKGL